MLTKITSIEEARKAPLRKFAVNGEEVVCGVVEGRPFAFASTCPHKGGPLDQGELLAPNRIRCPWHGYEFDVFDGEVLYNPYPPKYGKWRDTGRLKVFRAEERDGFVCLDV